VRFFALVLSSGLVLLALGHWVEPRLWRRLPGGPGGPSGGVRLAAWSLVAFGVLPLMIDLLADDDGPLRPHVSGSFLMGAVWCVLFGVATMRQGSRVSRWPHKGVDPRRWQVAMIGCGLFLLVFGLCMVSAEILEAVFSGLEESVR
jgi:hypothetical protein